MDSNADKARRRGGKGRGVRGVRGVGGAGLGAVAVF